MKFVKLLKLKRNKRGITDNVFMLTYFLIFVLLGVLLPFVNEAFQNPETNFNTEGLDDQFTDDTTLTQITLGVIFASIIKMMFWTFGVVPFWLDALLTIFRIHFAILIYRQIRSGGG